MTTTFEPCGVHIRRNARDCLEYVADLRNIKEWDPSCKKTKRKRDGTVVIQTTWFWNWIHTEILYGVPVVVPRNDGVLELHCRGCSDGFETREIFYFQTCQSPPAQTYVTYCLKLRHKTVLNKIGTFFLNYELEDDISGAMLGLKRALEKSSLA